ncbi:glutathione S-transferase family protein [Limibacillus sp. MBR-115]|jgi:glutathione S-transferase|uniref:glutathione S-transferase family protein n=1 Tax=Limibacillus sp. MBR-115 TaxID=3156465 RepID=UPI0033938AA0
MANWCLIIGNRNYSSWSLRAWLALEATGVDFEEVVIPLDRPDTAEKLRQWSPSLRVPVLQHGDLTIWDSLAISEYLADTFPEAKLWPQDAEARAIARCLAAEMHSGFADLREELPMDMRARRERPAMRAATKRDIARIVELWEGARAQYASRGPFLMGEFSIADAFHAPLVSRFLTYDIDLPKASEAYCDTITDYPPFAEWYRLAKQEKWVIAEP